MIHGKTISFRTEGFSDVHDVTDVSVVDRFSFSGRLDQYILRRTTLRIDHPAIQAGQSNGVDAAITQGREDLYVDLAPEDHLRKLKRVVVGDAAAFDHRLFDAQFVSEFRQLLSAAVHDAHVYSDLVQQRQFLSQGDQRRLMLGNLSGEFHHESGAFEPLNVRKSLAEQVERFDVHLISSVIIAFCT